MRTAPTALEQSGTAGNYVAYTGATARSCTAVPTFDNATITGWHIAYTVGSGQTTGEAGFFRASGGNSGFLAWSAEL